MHTPGAKARYSFHAESAKPEGLAYLEAAAKAKANSAQNNKSMVGELQKAGQQQVSMKALRHAKLPKAGGFCSLSGPPQIKTEVAHVRPFKMGHNQA